MTLSAPQMHSKSRTKATSEATNAAVTSTSGEHNFEDLIAWPTPAFWMLNSDPSTTFDWPSFVAEAEASTVQT